MHIVVFNYVTALAINIFTFVKIIFEVVILHLYFDCVGLFIL